MDEPPEGPEDHIFFKGFRILNTTRRTDGGPIPWDAIQDYCERIGLAEDAREIYTDVIMEMDAALIAVQHEEWEKRKKS